MTSLKELRKKLSRPRAKVVAEEKPFPDADRTASAIEKGVLEASKLDDFFYVSLHTAAPGEDLNNEVSFSGYARQAVKLKKDILSGSLTVEGAVMFPTFTEGSMVVTHFAISDKDGNGIASGPFREATMLMPGISLSASISIKVESLCLLSKT